MFGYEDVRFATKWQFCFSLKRWRNFFTSVISFSNNALNQSLVASNGRSMSVCIMLAPGWLEYGNDASDTYFAQ